MKDDKLKDLLSKVDPSKIHSFVNNGELIIPVMTDAEGMEGSMSPKQFMKFTSKMSDSELNALLYRQAKEMVEDGRMEPWPKDDWGILFWFEFSFITPEMRQVFPAIAREFLLHEPQVGTEFRDVPISRLDEEKWEDAFYFRILAMMVLSARRGSVYSRNFLISLYKVYYKNEYNRVKKLNRLTFLDLLNLHDEDCKRQGLPSGHATDGNITFRDYVIEKRKHEAGWTIIASTRRMDPVGGKIKPEGGPENGDPIVDNRLYVESRNYLQTMCDAPDEPPLQPVASRLFIMCEMLRIPIDETCNEQANEVCRIAESVMNVNYLGNDEYRKFVEELVERGKEYITASFPETADPALYQSNENYIPLEMAECILWGAFRKYDRNIRIPYGSKKFDLPDLMARVSVSLQQFFPDMEQNMLLLQSLAMVEYLCECLCELMICRDQQLDDLLHVSGRVHQDEWTAETDPLADERASKLLKSMGDLHGTEYVKPEIQPYVEPETDAKNTESTEELRAEIDRLRSVLAERESVLAETEQKLIRQRALYEQERNLRTEMEKTADNAATEHMELIALREYVYSLQAMDTSAELDETTQEQMVRDLQDKNVAVLGGTERWIRQMKRLFPRWKFISVEDDSIGGFHALESASYIYMYTNALQHKQYYRAINMIRKENKMLFYLGGTNRAENIMRMHRDLCK